MAFGKKNKEDIINIPLENLDVETDNIKVINEFYDTKGRKIKSYTLPVIEFVAVLLIVIGIMYAFLNFRFVEGDVIGKSFNIGPISVVSNQYEAADYISEGKLIYYDEHNPNPFPIDVRSNYDVNTITKIQDNRVFVKGSSSSVSNDVPVSKEDIAYVLEP